MRILSTEPAVAEEIQIDDVEEEKEEDIPGLSSYFILNRFYIFQNALF